MATSVWQRNEASIIVNGVNSVGVYGYKQNMKIYLCQSC